MKKYFFLILLLSCAGISFAQFQYTAAKAKDTAGTYTDLGTAGTAIITNFAGGPMTYDNTNSSIQEIGFSFPYNGIVFTQFVLNSNGYIKLGNTAPPTNIFQVLDSAVTNTIAAFNYHLTGGTSPQYRVFTSGATGSRVCIIQFKNLRDVADASTVQQYNNINFQIKLYETSNIIEFVYGSFTTSGMAPAAVTATVGVKGKNASSSANAAKLSTTAWSSATFINGNYTTNSMNNRNTLLPDAGRTFRFNPVNDAKVDAVYTLGKAPKPFGVYNHQVGAKIRNLGGASLSNYNVTLNITGANTFTNVKPVSSLAPGDSVVVNFDPVSLWTTGTNTVTVSVVSDDLNTNNSAAYTQVINDTLFSYADGSSPGSNKAGTGTNEGMMLASYKTNGGTAQITGVRVRISNDPACIGKVVRGVLWIYYTGQYVYSDSLVITAADTAKFKVFYFNNPVTISEGVLTYIGLKQKASATVYYPVSYQVEGPPCRPDAFFTSSPPYTSLSGYTAGRLMIEEIVKVAPPTIPETIEQLAAWNFSGMNSPVSAAATQFHQKLTSSNLLTRGPDAPPSAGINSFISTGFKNDGISTGNNDYFQFTIAAGVTDTLALHHIYFAGLNNDPAFFNPNGVYSQFAYSLNGTNFTLIDTPVHSPLNLNYTSYEVDLQNIVALQNLMNGVTVTFRYYATGNNTTGDFGFTTEFTGSGGIWLDGVFKVLKPVIIPAPVIPNGADFYLPNCNSTAPGSIDFTSIGTYPPGNVYSVKINNSQWYRDTVAITLGTLASSANSGTINFTIPGTLLHKRYNETDIWIESSLVPQALSVPSEVFHITYGSYCYSQNSAFRSKQSGNWNDINTWEMAKDRSGTDGWIPSTFIPDQSAYHVLINATDTVTIITPVAIRAVDVEGKLKVLNNAVNTGSITFYENIYDHSATFYRTMGIGEQGVLQIVSATAPFDSVIRMSAHVAADPSPEMIYINGKITIGDGSSANGPGFYQFANSPIRKKFYWLNNSVFEWNTTSTNSLIPTTYFAAGSSHAILRITKIGPGGFGGADSTVINGILEINTPVTVDGTGKKTFTDGIKGSSTLTQTLSSGVIETEEAYAIVPPSPDNVESAVVGYIDGAITINLSTAGVNFTNGITVTDTANVRIIGSGISHGNIEVQPGGKMNIDPASVLTIENANLFNDGTIDGTGKIQFTGSDTSYLKSPGIINAKIELLIKQLRLDGNATTSTIDLLGGSHLRLDSFHLNMRTGNLTGDAANFIITNDTGRLSRYVDNNANGVPFHIGVNETSYTPVTITNSVTSVPDNFMVRVGSGVFKDSAITQGNVNRTWFIKDSLKGGNNVTLKMQWNLADQQPLFDGTHSRVSHGSLCPPPINCSGSYFDYSPPLIATDIGSGNYTVQRSGIDSFNTNSFIVTSNHFVYTFTGTGDWVIPANWTPGVVPPDPIPVGAEVVINHSTAPNSECVHTGNITVATGGKLTVLPGKKLRIEH